MKKNNPRYWMSTYKVPLAEISAILGLSCEALRTNKPLNDKYVFLLKVYFGELSLADWEDRVNDRMEKQRVIYTERNKKYKHAEYNGVIQ